MESWPRPRIVVGVDGSEASVSGLRWAAQEAACTGAGLHVITAWEDAASGRAPYAPARGAPRAEDQRSAAAARLAACVHAALGPAPAVPLCAEVVTGPAGRVLLAASAGAHLLVIGSAPRSDRYRAPAGAVHRACLRGAPCPVVVVGAAARWPRGGGQVPATAGEPARDSAADLVRAGAR